MRPKGALWKLRWWWRWFLADNDAEAREHRRRFSALTGLHPCYVEGRFVADDEVIAMQARKIKGLELQLNQQRKGYQKKVAKLERALSSSHGLSGQGGHGTPCTMVTPSEPSNPLPSPERGSADLIPPCPPAEGVLLTLLEGLMEGLSEDAGLTSADRNAMRWQIEALEEALDQIRDLPPSTSPQPAPSDGKEDGSSGVATRQEQASCPDSQHSAGGED